MVFPIVNADTANHVTTISSLSHLLADASAAAVDAASAASSESDGGWWKAYLNIFKTAIELVHSTIDPPLRAAGFTQTWGLSIAIFTAGTCVFVTFVT